MPIYEYECEKCSLRFELRRRFSENGGAECPECHGEAHRLFSPVAIIFKGPGFYVTDSRNNHGHTLSDNKVDEAKGKKEPESK